MLGMLVSLDDAIGNVTKAIRLRGLYNNSVIVFSSDNGGAVGGAPQHGSMNNFPLRTFCFCFCFCFCCAVLIIKWS